MAQTLDEFIKDANAQLLDFEQWWRREHEKNPEVFPLEMASGSEGLWYEILQTRVRWHQE